MDDLHSLELNWWNSCKPDVTSLPASSRCFISSTHDKNNITVQVAQHICTLPLRWRPIFILIDLCQLESLHRIRQKENTTTHSKLLQWYDQLRQHIVVQAKWRKEDPADEIFWIPQVVHRFCVRVESQIPHQHKKFLKVEDLLKKYSKSPWSYGELQTI
jgi:hypothetical protein